MPVSRDDVRHIAQLARLGLPAERVDALMAELSGILDHMAVLSEVDTAGVDPVAGVGTGGTPLREDAGDPIPLARPLESFAPAARDGFILVPRLATHEDVGEMLE